MHISETVGPRVTKFGKGMDVDDPKVDPEGQGHRSKVKVTRSKNMTLCIVTVYNALKKKQVGSCQRQVAFF